MRQEKKVQSGVDRRSFLMGAALPLLWRTDKLLAQQRTVAQELLLDRNRVPMDPARTLRDYCLETELTPETAAIICPPGQEYERIGHDLSEALAPDCGGRLEVRILGSENNTWPLGPRHLILIGNAINNPLIFRLYVNHYTLVDEYFPGPKGEFVHSVHNPFGDSKNAFVLGASDVPGAATAAKVLLSIVRKNGPKLGFTLHSRSSRMRSDAPSEADFESGLRKRKEQIDVGDTPWLATDYGMLYHLTGDQRWGELFRELHLYGIHVARARHTWPRSIFDNDFYVYRLLTAWDLIEESPIFSNDDRRAITQLCLETSRYVDGMWYLNDFFTGQLKMLNNHQTFPAISIFMAHRYFSKYYGWQEFALKQQVVDTIFAMHNTSWRPNDNDEGVGVRTHRHLINYSLIQGDYTYFDTGRERLLADWIVMVTDNRADTLAFGDAGEYDGVYQGGRKRIQDQYMLGPLSLAAWYYQDGRYAWARDWFRKGLDWKDRLDFDQLLGKRYGWQERYGITEWEFYLGWLFRDHLEPSPPQHLLGVAVARYDEAGRVLAGAEEIPREEAFDKLTFRAGFGRMDEYLAIEGVATMPHSHDDANCIMRLTWNDRIWISEGDEMKQLRRYHNGIVTVRNGEHYSTPLIAGNPSGAEERTLARGSDLARLKAFGTLGNWGVSQTVLPDDNGLDWERNIVWRRGEFFVVLDRLLAVRAGEYSVECRWRTLGDVRLEGREMKVEQNGESFSLYNTDDSALSLSYRDGLYEPDREDYRFYEHSKDGYQRILRQSQRRDMKPGDQLQYVNLLQVTTKRKPSEIALIHEGLALIKGGSRALIGVAERGTRVGPLEIKARIFVVDHDGVHVFGGSNITWEGRSLWESKTGENADVRIPNADAVLAVEPALKPTPTSLPRSEVSSAASTPEWKVAFGGTTTAMHQFAGMIAIGNKEGQVGLFDVNGAKKAALSLPSTISTVYVLPQGQIALGTRDTSLALAGSDGRILWEKLFGHGIRQRPKVPSACLSFEGDLLIGMEDESLFRFGLDGKEIWYIPCNYHAVTQLATVKMSGRSNIMAGFEYGTINLVSPNGQLIWEKWLGPVAALSSANLFGNSQQEILYGNLMGISVLRSADGDVRWSANMGGEVLDVMPVKSEDEGFDVCTASDVGNVARFQSDGTTRWRRDSGEPLTAMAVGERTMALGCLSGNVQLRELSTGRLRAVATLESAIFKLSILQGRSDQFIGITENGTLFALSEPS